MVRADNEEELGKHLKNNESSIELGYDLERKVVRLKATGPVAWAIAFGAIGVAVIGALATVGTGGFAAPVGLGAAAIAAPAAVAILGGSATTAAIAIAVAAGGTGVLSKLRDYKLVEENGKTYLKR